MAHKEVLQELKRESRGEIVVGTAIELRVHYEIHLRRNPERSAVYILTAGEMLPDISIRANKIRFKIAELFPNFVDKATISQLSFSVLSKLYDKHIQGIVTSSRLHDLVSDLNDIQSAEPIKDFGEAVDIFNAIENPDWSDVATIRRISELFVKVVESDRYDEIADTIDYLNFDFQHYLDDTYWNSINANPLLKPRCVNGILRHVRDNYELNEKIALVVVDGMAFWQYGVLRDELERIHVHPIQEDWIYSWIPSITSLSRQAIFGGEYPLFDYTQSPNNEKSTWQSHWPTNASQYFYDNGVEPLRIAN
ncbi:MAG: PglZ domain-containing protein, partial [Muribaculaceae bacterium]|nr:PglZ domain-containing protein [Muribaculaceae bacterium]